MFFYFFSKHLKQMQVLPVSLVLLSVQRGVVTTCALFLFTFLYLINISVYNKVLNTYYYYCYYYYYLFIYIRWNLGGGLLEKPINQKTMYKTYHLQQDLRDAQKVGLHSLLQNGAENEVRWWLVSCQMEVSNANKPWFL